MIKQEISEDTDVVMRLSIYPALHILLTYHYITLFSNYMILSKLNQQFGSQL